MPVDRSSLAGPGKPSLSDDATAPAKSNDGAAADAAARRMVEAPTIQVGGGGILKQALKVGDKNFDAGTFGMVEQVKGDKLTVELYPDDTGQVVDVPALAFQPEPRLAPRDGDPKEPDWYHFDEYTSFLWGPDGPKASDVGQGHLSDCFFNAAMGAVAAANPEQIKSLFSPQSPNEKQYTVKLFDIDNKGKATPRYFAVDTFLPSDHWPAMQPAYSGNEFRFGDHDHALWPSLLEKAAAEMKKGGYAKLNEGGAGYEAMQLFTGIEGDIEMDVFDLPAPKILEQFQKWSTERIAVTCGTITQEGVISPELNLHGDHEYIFESVQGDKLVFKNPWGEQHPNPVPINAFKQLFNEISTDNTRKKG